MRSFWLRVVCVGCGLFLSVALCGFARVYPQGTRIGGIDVSRLTRSAAAERVKASIEEELSAEPFVVRVGEDEYVFRPPEFYCRTDLPAALSAASHGGDVPLQKEFCIANLETALRGILDNYYIKSAPARILFDPNKDQPFTVVRRRTGSYADGAKLLADVRAALKSGGRYAEAEVIRVQPPFGEAEALRSVSLLSSFTTYFNEGNAPRVHNIRLAAAAVNGCVLAAGEKFSFNAATGARTAERGYREAPIILDGEYTPGVGGGVCQVSTTLYNAMLLAGLDVTEHHAHSLPVGYVEPSFDAMVSGKSCDLKCKNVLQGKVYFVLRVRGNALRVRVYGERQTVTYERESVTKALLEPPEPEVRENAKDSELRAGKAGLQSEGWLICREQGKPVRRIFLRKDIYRPQRGVVRAAQGEQDVESAPQAEGKP